MDKYIEFDLNIKKTVVITQLQTGDKNEKESVYRAMDYSYLFMF